MTILLSQKNLPEVHNAYYLNNGEIAVITYKERNGDIVTLRFQHGQERDMSFALHCIAEYDPAFTVLLASSEVTV